jgi:hypothetical protein
LWAVVADRVGIGQACNSSSSANTITQTFSPGLSRLRPFDAGQGANPLKSQ